MIEDVRADDRYTAYRPAADKAGYRAVQSTPLFSRDGQSLGMLSTLTAERLVRAIRERDIATLQSVPRVGRKKAEQLILDLADKLDDVQADLSSGAPRPAGAGVEDAVRALVSLGYSVGEAERAVGAALDGNGRGMPVAELIRASLARVGSR